MALRLMLIALALPGCLAERALPGCLSAADCPTGQACVAEACVPPDAMAPEPDRGADAQPRDAAPGDAAPDRAPADAAPPALDQMALDQGPADASLPDAAPPDAAPPDAIPLDAATPDAIPPDGAPPADACEGVVVPDGFVCVPPGSFVMGTPAGQDDPRRVGADAEPEHAVALTRAFLMMRHEVGLAAWDRLLPDPTTRPAESNRSPERPVSGVSRPAVLAFANALSLEAGLPPCYLFGAPAAPVTLANHRELFDLSADARPMASLDCAGFRLPTEAEWEYAARGGDRALAPADMWCDVAAPRSGQQPPPVSDCREESGFGLCNMVGSLDEWTEDLRCGADGPAGVCDGLVGEAPLVDPATLRWFPGAVHHIGRGGSGYMQEPMCRYGARRHHDPRITLSWMGFRLVRTLGP